MMSGWTTANRQPSTTASSSAPGGKDAILVALDKLTGNVMQMRKPDEIRGATSIVRRHRRRAAIHHAMGPQLGIVGVHAQTGKFLWNYKKVANGI